MNKRWEVECGLHKLIFTSYGEEECVLTFIQSAEDPICFYYSSKLLKIEDEVEFASSVSMAKDMFEFMIADYFQTEISYYQELLDAWMEE